MLTRSLAHETLVTIVTLSLFPGLRNEENEMENGDVQLQVLV